VRRCRVDRPGFNATNATGATQTYKRAAQAAAAVLSELQARAATYNYTAFPHLSLHNRVRAMREDQLPVFLLPLEWVWRTFVDDVNTDLFQEFTGFGPRGCIRGLPTPHDCALDQAPMVIAALTALRSAIDEIHRTPFAITGCSGCMVPAGGTIFFPPREYITADTASCVNPDNRPPGIATFVTYRTDALDESPLHPMAAITSPTRVYNLYEGSALAYDDSKLSAVDRAHEITVQRGFRPGLHRLECDA
jgi:hypothetical protein